MDDVLRKLRSEGGVVGPFGYQAEAFARSVGTARKLHRPNTRGFRDRADWRLDPRVLAALIALEEDR